MFSRWPACIQRPWLLTAFMPDALEGPRLILLGAPASGKGRQSELLVSSFELTHISTGAVLREVLTADRVHPLWFGCLITASGKAALSETALAKEISAAIQACVTVPDDATVKALAERLKQATRSFRALG